MFLNYFFLVLGQTSIRLVIFAMFAVPAYALAQYYSTCILH